MDTPLILALRNPCIDYHAVSGVIVSARIGLSSAPKCFSFASRHQKTDICSVAGECPPLIPSPVQGYGHICPFTGHELRDTVLNHFMDTLNPIFRSWLDLMCLFPELVTYNVHLRTIPNAFLKEGPRGGRHQ
jgi:hypothetical protein